MGRRTSKFIKFKGRKVEIDVYLDGVDSFIDCAFWDDTGEELTANELDGLANSDWFQQAF